MEYIRWVFNGFQTSEQSERRNFIRRINERRIWSEYPLKKITPHYDNLAPEQLHPKLFDAFKNLVKNNDINEYFIGGSYALKRYSNANWNANDVDIFIQYNKHTPKNDKGELEINLGLSGLAVTHVWCRDRDPPNTDEEELFHDAIQQVTTYHGNDMKIQLVYIKDDWVRSNNKQILTVLNKITDYPAHVFYRKDLASDFFIFYTTELMDECIKHKIIPKTHCPHERRRNKYEARGYEFV